MARQFLNGLDLANTLINNVGSPSASTDAANKAYVDASAAGLNWKKEVRAATTANGALSTAYANTQVVDGVTLATGDRILLKNQTTATDNGIYTVNASGAPTRASDFNTNALVQAGATVSVAQGTANKSTAWTTSYDPDTTFTIGTTNVTWALMSASAVIAAGNGISVAGSTVTAVADTTTSVVANSVQVTSNGIAVNHAHVPLIYAATISTSAGTPLTVTHNLGTQDIQPTLWSSATGGTVVEADITNDGTGNAVTVITAASQTNMRIVIHG